MISPQLLHLLFCLSAGVKFRSQQVQRHGAWDHAAKDSASLQAQTAAAGWLAGTLTTVLHHQLHASHWRPVFAHGSSYTTSPCGGCVVDTLRAPTGRRSTQCSFSLQSSHGVCSLSDQTISVIEDCDVPQASFIKQLIFFFSSTSTRRMVHTHSVTHASIDEHDSHSYCMKEMYLLITQTDLEFHWSAHLAWHVSFNR